MMPNTPADPSDAAEVEIEFDPPLPVMPVDEDAPDDLAAIAEAAEQAVPGDHAYLRQGFGSRLVAGAVDLLFAGLFVLLLVLLQHAFDLFSWLFRYEYGGLVAVMFFPLAWLLYTSTEVFTVGTPGKRILGLRIARPDFTPSTRRQRLWRWLIRRCSPLLTLTSIVVLQSDWLSRHVPYVASVLSMAPWLVQIPLFAMFCGCLRRSRLAYYDQWFGTAVIHDLDQKRSHDSGFSVMVQPVGGSGQAQ